MTLIDNIVERLAAWLRDEEFTPPLRLISTVALCPPPTYPHLAILLDREEFGPGAGDATATLRLRVSQAGGKPASTQQQLRSLAHQVRVSLAKSHGLGGSVKHLRTAGINYGSRAEEGSAEPVAICADVLLELKYTVGVLNTGSSQMISLTTLPSFLSRT